MYGHGSEAKQIKTGNIIQFSNAYISGKKRNYINEISDTRTHWRRKAGKKVADKFYEKPLSEGVISHLTMADTITLLNHLRHTIFFVW